MDQEEKFNTLGQSSRTNQQLRQQQQSTPQLHEEDNNQEKPMGIKYKYYPQISLQPNQLQQIIYWVLLTALIIVLAYLKYDNHSQQKDVMDIMEAIQRQATEISQLQNQQNGGDYHKGQKSVVFFPEKAWYFSHSPINQTSLWTQKCFQAYQNKVRKLGFDLIVINVQNYSRFLKEERNQFIEQQIKGLNKRYQVGTQPQIIKYRELIIKQLIIIEILIQNGGIYVDQDIILTEDLSWIQRIYANKYINARQWIDKVELFAFHSTFLSPNMKKSTLIQVDAQTQKYIVEIPTVSSYFIAVVKDNNFLKDLRSQYTELLGIKSKYLKDKLQRQQLQINFAQKNIHFYKYLFEISSQIALHKKQKALGPQNAVIKYYQLATINQNYGPTKLKAYLEQNQPIKNIRHLTRMTRQQLEYEFGRMKYMIRIEPIQDYYDLLLEEIQKKLVVKNSIIHLGLFESRRMSFLQKIQGEEINSQRWDTLPSNMWTYSKDNQNNLFSQIWRKYNHFISIQAKFRFIILNEQNLHQYLSQESIKQIEQSINSKDNQLKIHDKTKMEMISLAVLYEHGGVWIDPQIFLVGNLDWLRNINQQPFIWSKSGSFPKVLLPFHPHYISPFEWKYNQKGVKEAWHLGYQRDFIAAQPKSQLLKLWLSEYIVNLKIHFQELKNKFYNCKIVSNMWIKEDDHSFVAQDTLKCILGAKKVQFINTQNSLSPSHYYGLWAINGFSGLLKMRENTDFLSASRSMQNPLIWRKSFDEMQELTGRIRYFTRIYYPSSAKIEELSKNNINNLQNEIHNGSFFMKLLQKINDTVTMHEGRVQLAKQVNLFNRGNQNS